MLIVSHKHKFIFIRPRKVAGTSLSVALEPSLGSSDVQVFAPRELESLAGSDGALMVRPRNVDALRLRDRSRPHILPSTVKDRFGEEVWERYFKFTIVRNPWDWFVSLHVYWLRWYDFEIKGEGLVRFERARHLYSRAKAVVFDQRDRDTRLAQQLLQAGRIKESVEFALRKELYSTHFADMEQHYFVSGCRYANDYLRFENLLEDYAKLCSRLGIEQRSLPRLKDFRPNYDDYQPYYTAWSRRQVADKCAKVIETFDYRFD